MKTISQFVLLMALCAPSASAFADAKYTRVMSVPREGQMTPMSTTITALKAGLQRVDTTTDVRQFHSTETVITDVAKNQRFTLDPKLKIYVAEPLQSATTKGSAADASTSTTTGAVNGKKSKLVMTLGAQFLGTERMLDMDARHYKTSMQIETSGDCGNSKTSIKSEVWNADVELPTLNLPNENANGGAGYGAGGNDGCAVITETTGDTKGYEAAQKGLALKMIFFGTDGKPNAQQEITMLSLAALDDAEFAVPADFSKVTRADYDKARQNAMMAAFATPASADVAPAEAPHETSAPPKNINPTPVAYVPVAIKNDPKLDKSLLAAAKDGHVEAALAALQNGANPNAADKGGTTPLMLAAQNGKTELVRALLDMGANPNAVNKKGQSALHLATTIGAPKPKKFGLGSLGAALGGGLLGGNLGNLGGGNLDALLGSNLQGLLNGGAFHLSGKSGWSAILGTALQGDLKSNGALGMQKLLGSGALDAQGWVGLIGAVKGSNANVLSAMSNIGGANNAQWSQFIQSAASGDVASVTSLMNDPQMQPLLAQAMQGFSAASGELPVNAAQSITRALIEKGANPTLADGSGKTAAQLAQSRDWNDLAALLQK